MTYAGAGRWLACVTLVAVVDIGLALAENMWIGALSFVSAFIFISAPPAFAALSSAPRMSLTVYLFNGMTSILIITLTLPFLPSDIDEPWFSRPVAAALSGAALSIGLGLGVLPLVLWRRFRARSRQHIA
ncbi:MAG: hypothetical protein C0506_15545 [Anaerolinea sp.]|nr:hypothetical protein [Anaerolinea sp.]